MSIWFTWTLFISTGWLVGATEEPSCEVAVWTPWEKTTYVPQNSVIHIKCTVEEGQNPFWSIQLPESDNFINFGFPPNSKTILNSRGFYEIPEDAIPETIQLVINGSNDNNSTSIRCVEGINFATLFETDLLVYEPIMSIMYTTHDMGIQSITVSWSPMPSAEAYTLTVKSDNTFTSQFVALQPFYFFTDEDAPLCEVYNFSVTAAYGGANYTGADCSVSSPVLSVMLPSLPDIYSLESSISRSLSKQVEGGVNFTINFQPANYCEDYPVQNYTLIITDSSLKSNLRESINSTSETTELKLSVDLVENEKFTFQVHASNCVGTTETNPTTIYTTDVQKVRVLVPGDFDSDVAVVQCTFIAKSDARGCMVILFSENNSMALNLTREMEFNMSCAEINLFNESIQMAYGFDIEADGSIGTLFIVGVIETKTNGLKCDADVKDTPNFSFSTYTILVISVPSAVVLLVLMIMCTITFLLKIKNKRASVGPTLHVQPMDPEGITHKGMEDSYNSEEEDKAGHEETENFYHVLEESTPCDISFPVYQELNNMSTVGADLDRAESNNSSCFTSPCVGTIQDSQNTKQPPVYQHIEELPAIQENSV